MDLSTLGSLVETLKSVPDNSPTKVALTGLVDQLVVEAKTGTPIGLRIREVVDAAKCTSTDPAFASLTFANRLGLRAVLKTLSNLWS